MSTERYWDWSDGIRLLRAKSVANKVAYITGSRAVARMRAFVAFKHMGVDVGDPTETLTAKVGWKERNFLSSPAWAGQVGYTWCGYERGDAPMPPLFAQFFFVIYNTAFTGRLPVLVLHLQRLGDYGIEEELPFEDKFRERVLGERDRGHGPYITGMTLGPNVDLTKGRPEFSYLDFFLRGEPGSSAGAREAQAALNGMAEFSFWKPLLIAEGITSDSDLKLAEQVLQVLKAEIKSEIRESKKQTRNVQNALF